MVLKLTLADLLGDRVVYRNLVPADSSLPALQDVCQELGLEAGRLPRKTEPAYAAVIFRLLQAAQAARGAPPISNMLFLGDTHMLDGTAARNLAAHAPLRGFIGADRLAEPERITYDGVLMVANRWQSLAELPDWAQRAGLTCDERTAILVDIDKTFIGARGRNDRTIDAARVTAVCQTAEALLGTSFDETGFRAIYDALNKPQYHPFTADNQDYLAYICLMVVGDVFPADELWAELALGHLTGFTQFVTVCDARRQRMAEGLAVAHREVISNMRHGDPTPFKSFRHREYFATVGRMDWMPDDTPLAELLAQEILITEEVVQLLRRLLAAGALTFGISDKPDEASLPPQASAAQGKQPIHRTLMKVAGQAR